MPSYAMPNCARRANMRSLAVILPRGGWLNLKSWRPVTAQAPAGRICQNDGNSTWKGPCPSGLNSVPELLVDQISQWLAAHEAADVVEHDVQVPLGDVR